MMPPGSTHSPRRPPSSDIDEAPPQSSSSDGSRTLSGPATGIAPLADGNIYIAPDGRRFRIEPIHDENWRGGQYAESAHLQPVSPTTPYAALPKEYVALNNASNRRRPVSNAASPPPGASASRPSAVRSPSGRGAEPKVATRDVVEMLTHLNINRFSDTPFYYHSDGGVQAAETLTDPDPAPGLPVPQSPVFTSPTISSAAPPTYQGPPQRPDYADCLYAERQPARHGSVLSNQGVTFMPDPFQTQAIEGYYQYQQHQRGLHSPHGSISQSFMETSTAIPRPSVSPLSPHIPPPYLQTVYGQDEVAYPTSPSFQGLHTVNQPYVPSEDAPRSPTNWLQSTQRENLRPRESINPYDTQTPVVVIESGLELAQPFPPLTASRSDGASTTRETVLPGEELLYDGPIKIAQSLASPFADAFLKAFRNTLSNDLRFHCRVGHESENFWMRGSKGQIVPVYAYDQRFSNVLYLRDNEGDGKRGGHSASSPTPGPWGSGQPSGVFQFSRIQELCDFQAKLTGEKVVLDISSVKLVRVSRSSSRTSETFSSVRVQIWHEDDGVRGRSGSQSDVASFVTAGTTLSGPLRDRLVASSSRLMVFLGRLEEYLTLFITDDIEVSAEGATSIKIKPRKGSVFKRGGSRWPGVKAKRESRRGNEPAGLEIHGQAADPDQAASFDLYETFEIEFESSPSQDNFVRKWGEVMKERRRQRDTLDRIQEEMRQATFTGRAAREIW